MCSDADDWSARDGAVAAAVLTASAAPIAPFVPALILGALCHAGRLGRTLPEQAALIDDATALCVNLGWPSVAATPRRSPHRHEGVPVKRRVRFRPAEPAPRPAAEDVDRSSRGSGGGP